MILRFELPGDPVGWQRTGIRVVHTRHGKAFPQVFTPAKTRDYERAIALAAKVARRGRPLLDGPICLKVTAFMRVPKSWSNRNRDAALAGLVRPTGKPDWDNLGKGVSDALNGVAYEDDSIVVDARVIKIYAENPRLKVEVWRAEPGDLL